jgi:hypothetical protein
MSKFIDEKQLKQIDLGDGEWVKIPEKISYGTIADFGGVDGTDIEKTTKFLITFIKEWNLKDGDGNVPEVTEDNVKRLDVGTIRTIMEGIMPLITVEGKKFKPSASQ